MKVTLYSFGKKEGDLSRVVRVRWTLQELELPYDEIDVGAAGLRGTPEMDAISPLGALPAVVVDGKPYFESAAICTLLADRVPERGLSFPSGTDERAEHDQWVSFALTGMEAWLWANTKHTFRYPEEKRIPAVVPLNTEEFHDAARALESRMKDREYLVGNRFSVTDIIVGYTLHWAKLVKGLKPYPGLTSYLERLSERPACALSRKKA